jgi:hypothetical protein
VPKEKIKKTNKRLIFKKLFIGADHAFGHGSRRPFVRLG